MLKRDSALIDAVSIGKLDCMGTIVDVAAFCKKERASDPAYARATVEAASKKVKCLSATRVIMSYQCVGTGGLCEDKDIGCYKLQERFAANLKTAHVSILEGKKGKVLNCYFSSKADDEDLKLRL